MPCFPRYQNLTDFCFNRMFRFCTGVLSQDRVGPGKTVYCPGLNMNRTARHLSNRLIETEGTFFIYRVPEFARGKTESKNFAQ